MKSIIISLLRKLRLKKEEPIKYKIGKMNYHNSLIDTLIPQMVEIGENFVSAPNSIILAHDASTFYHTGKYRVEKTIIGDNVFLGANATILPGVKVGNNSIIGAGSVVTKDVPTNTVVAGNPAKILCSVSDYINKCEHRNVLYEAPDSFRKIYDNERLVNADINQFQKKIMTEIVRREAEI